MRSLAQARLKRARAVELLAAGHSYAEIAGLVGYTNRGSAHRAVTKALEEREIEAVDHLRALESERLDRLYAAYWHPALDGDIAATKILVAISAERRRLYGIFQQRPRERSLYGGAALVQP
jgi:hypothetical protein